MYKIIKLKSGETPDRDSKIFPQFDIKEAKILSTKNDPTSSEYITFVKRYSTLVPIKRHGHYYLIPFMKQFEKQFADVNEGELDNFHNMCVKDCERIIDKFIVDPEWVNNLIEDRAERYFTIYKYVD